MCARRDRARGVLLASVVAGARAAVALAAVALAAVAVEINEVDPLAVDEDLFAAAGVAVEAGARLLARDPPVWFLVLERAAAEVAAPLNVALPELPLPKVVLPE